jgi:hypothetical protein
MYICFYSFIGSQGRLAPSTLGLLATSARHPFWASTLFVVWLTLLVELDDSRTCGEGWGKSRIKHWFVAPDRAERGLNWQPGDTLCCCLTTAEHSSTDRIGQEKTSWLVETQTQWRTASQRAGGASGLAEDRPDRFEMFFFFGGLFFSLFFFLSPRGRESPRRLRTIMRWRDPFQLIEWCQALLLALMHSQHRKRPFCPAMYRRNQHKRCTFLGASGNSSCCCLVLDRIRESWFEDSNLLANFAGERKIRIFYWGFKSLLPGKKAPKNVKNCQTFCNF